MPNRRQILELGLAASVWPGLISAAQPATPRTPAEAFPSFQLYKAIYEQSYALAVDFAARMASRGIPEADAKALLTRAFVADAIDRIGEEDVREAFHREAEAWFA